MAAQTTSNDDMLPPQQQEHEEDTCRICRLGAEANRPLFHPCSCSGSIKFVHEDCLVSWIDRSKATHCELCKKQFHFLKSKL